MGSEKGAMKMNVTVSKGVLFIGLVAAAVYGLYATGALNSVINLLKF